MTRRKRGTWVIGGAEREMKETGRQQRGGSVGSGYAEFKNQLRTN